MKVAYFFLSDGNPDSGVSKKVTAEINALRQCGVDIKFILVGHEKKEKSLPKKFLFLKFFFLFKRLLEIRRELHLCINSLGRQDVLYFRIGIFPLLAYPINFFKLFRSCKVVSEHQTIESIELLHGGEIMRYLNEIIFGRFIRRQYSGTISVTDEIRLYQEKKIHNRNIPCITISNGINVDSVRLRAIPPYLKDRIDLLSVSNNRYWHGIDRIFLGLVAYRGTVNIVIHIAGSGPELSRLQKMVTDLHISDHVVFHGFLSGNQLNSLFDKCHIAVGSLGIHRKGLTQTSELKSREYCARGIPFLIAAIDSDFPTDFPYILKIPADDSPINFEDVITFAKKVSTDSDHPIKMHNYAKEELDWSKKMKKLKLFCEKLITV